MNLTNAISGRPALAAAVAVILVLAAGAVQATPPAAKTPVTSLASAPAPAATVVLEYKMPAGRSLTYLSKSEETQVMEIQGQSMDTQSTNSGTFTFKAKGLKDKNFLLGVTIDDIVTTMTSNAQGDMSPNMSELKGKSFDMVLSPLGSEVDVSGAEAITYDIAGDIHNLSSGFKMFFPDLPGKPVKVGDTWPSSAGTDEKTTSMNIRIDFQNVNTRSDSAVNDHRNSSTDYRSDF